jgi:hypothetical protein
MIPPEGFRFVLARPRCSRQVPAGSSRFRSQGGEAAVRSRPSQAAGRSRMIRADSASGVPALGMEAIDVLQCIMPGAHPDGASAKERTQ